MANSQSAECTVAKGQSFLGLLTMDELEVKLQAGSLVAAFLCIPAIFMQSPNSHTLIQVGPRQKTDYLQRLDFTSLML